MLGFVVSDPKAACSPSWGGFYSFDQAAKALDLDRRVAQARGQGASVLGSFGGQANSELATGCTNQDALVGAYRSVLDRYHLAGLDFDIEGTAVDDTAATDRRAEAVRTLQREVGESSRSGSPCRWRLRDCRPARSTTSAARSRRASP